MNVRVIEIEDAVVIGERLLVAAELLEENPRTAVQHLDAHFVGVGDVELAFENVAKLGPLPRGFVEVRESPERLRVFATKIEDALPGLDGPRGVVQPIGREV